MPPRIERLPKRADFLRAAGRGRKCATPGLVLQALVRDDGGPVRLGLTASPKVGPAVVRNRVRRRLRAAARELLAELSRPGLDVVLIGRASTAGRPFEELKQDLRRALTRTGAVRTGAAGP